MDTPQEILKYFAGYIEANLGIVYSETNWFQLESRVKDLVTLLSLKSVQELYDKTRAGLPPEMKQLLLDVATNNETSFFRDVDLFTALREQVLVSKRFDGSDGKPLKIWCAATSTGQEPYSIAMMLEEQARLLPQRKYSLLGTDISERVLQRAKAGLYTQLEVQRGLPAPLMIKYFQPVQDPKGGLPGFQIKSEIKANLTFKKMNLLEEWGNIGPFDLIFCRNVLIYQAVENKRKVIEKMAKLLNPGGLLILGAAESLIALSDSFELEKFAKASLYRLKGPAPLRKAV